MLPDGFVVPEERLSPVFDEAGHVEDGTIHAWLDGAMDAAAAAWVERHVAECVVCAAQVAEARGLVAASSRVLAALDASPAALPAAVKARAAIAKGGGIGWRPQWWWRAAAGLVVVIGGTMLLRHAERRGGAERAGKVAAPAVTPAVTPADTPAVTPEAAPAVTPEDTPAVTPEAPPLAAPGATTPMAVVPAAAVPAGETASGGAAPVVSPRPGTTSSATALNNGMTSGVTAFPGKQGTAEAAASRVAAAPMPMAPTPAPPMAGAGVPSARRLASAPASDVAPPRRGDGRAPGARANREQYDRIEDNPFLGVRTNPLSTFSIDVDRASYGNVRRFLSSGQRPPRDAVRIEELINYFPYELPEPRGADPVAISSEVMTAPWQPQHRLVRITLQARRIATASLPPSNLVFLIDVSGSMNEWNKLPLVKQSLRLLVNELRPQDRVAIVAYAGAAGLVLPSTSGDEKARIADAIDRLEAGGSTAGGAGIELAYRTAREHFLERGNNRVILATDGDFNVGVSSDAELERLVEQHRRDGTYLTVLGFGTGNYQAAKMEKLAKVGNGNSGYVDSPAEARKLLVEELGATLLTVANDVKLQVEFNPSRVQSYRLIGYENRLLATEDFNDDAKDAGDIGTGHQVTALYEVVPAGVQGTVPVRTVDSLRYVTPDVSMRRAGGAAGDELLFVKLRYKRPGNASSQLLSHAVPSRISARPSTDARFIAAVASFGMLLRDSEYRGNSSAAQVLEQARAALGEDRGGYRAEFVRLVEQWRALGVTAGERR